MAITKTQKGQIVKKFKKGDLDTGSCEVQVALLTARINDLTGHFTKHKKDHHGRRGLVKCVNQRKKLLAYLANTDMTRYSALIQQLDIRG